MANTREKMRTITIHDLKPGDIVILDFVGIPHATIYAPIPGKNADLIQMGYGLKRSGAIKSTLSQQLRDQRRNAEVIVVRSKRFDGAAIAAQAEFWLRQGVVFDEQRLSCSLFNYSYPDALPKPSMELNIFEYLKYAARRETMPVKTNIYPYNYSSLFTLAGIGLLTPFVLLCQFIGLLGLLLVRFGFSISERPRGLTCAGFVLACIAAVALRDEIRPVTGKTGWISLKYTNPPRRASAAYLNTMEKVNNEIGTHSYNGPGLHDVLSTEHFDLQRLSDKLTPLLTKLNPHQPSAREFFECLTNDPDNWELLGRLDKSVVRNDFNRDAYRKETDEILTDIAKNREKFYLQFGLNIFNRHHNGSGKMKSFHLDVSRLAGTGSEKGGADTAEDSLSTLTKNKQK